MGKIENSRDGYLKRSDIAQKASQKKAPAEKLTPTQKLALLDSFGRHGRAGFVPFGKILRS